MGTANVTAVYIYWSHLDHAPFRLLSHMALKSVDAGSRAAAAIEPDLYWLPLSDQAEAMGYAPHGKATVRQLRKLRAQLVDAGAISLESSGSRWRSTTWRLHPVPRLPPSDPLPWLGGH
jgi:hypothetical protein